MVHRPAKVSVFDILRARRLEVDWKGKFREKRVVVKVSLRGGCLDNAPRGMGSGGKKGMGNKEEDVSVAFGRDARECLPSFKALVFG